MFFRRIVHAYNLRAESSLIPHTAFFRFHLVTEKAVRSLLNYAPIKVLLQLPPCWQCGGM